MREEDEEEVQLCKLNIEDSPRFEESCCPMLNLGLAGAAARKS